MILKSLLLLVLTLPLVGATPIIAPSQTIERYEVRYLGGTGGLVGGDLGASVPLTPCTPTPTLPDHFGGPFVPPNEDTSVTPPIVVNGGCWFYVKAGSWRISAVDDLLGEATFDFAFPHAYEWDGSFKRAVGSTEFHVHDTRTLRVLMAPGSTTGSLLIERIA